MKKKLSAALAACMMLTMLLPLAGCGGQDERPVLRVYNWEDYISEPTTNADGSVEDDYVDLIAEFEEEYGVRVEYSTFGTNENMYNELQINPGAYDLVCPSDYMIMKMIAEDMVQPFSDEFLQNSNYAKYASPYIKDLFEENGWTEYAVAYMWGTMGYVYDPERVSGEELSSWAGLWKEENARVATIKDSVRDSYFLGVAYVYREELMQLKGEYESGELSPADYNAAVTKIMNRTDEETIDRTKEAMIELKQHLYGFEVDSGKQDMVTGKISINFAWSGDAVYAMDVAEDAEDGEGSVTLNYYMPEESANLWFDGWVIPKDDNRTEETRHAAEAFVNFLSAPENAVRNSYYIGYTSVIAGEEMFAYMEDTYSAEEDDETATDYDLSYFFGEGDYVISAPAEQLERQLYAQYPPEEEMLRCAVMDYYGENDERINELWTQIKGETLDAWAIAVICAAVVLIAGFTVYVKLGAKTDFFRPRPKKGYKKVSSVPVSYQK